MADSLQKTQHFYFKVLVKNYFVLIGFVLIVGSTVI